MKSKTPPWIAGVLAGALFLISASFPFFGDAQIHSAHAQSFQFWAPPHADFAHPPLYNFLLMLFWAPLGPALWSAHLLSTCFILGILWIANKLETFRKTPLFLLFLEPVFLAQSFQINAELYLLFGYFLCLYSIEKKRPLLLSTALVFLSLGSLRGVFLLPALALHLLWLKCPKKEIALAFLPALCCTALWFFMHYQHSGWFLTPPNAEGHRGLQSPLGFIRNSVVFIWYLFDYGRALLFASLAFLYWKLPLTNKNKDLLPALFPLLLIAGFCIPFTNPFGERYFLIPLLLFLGIFWRWSALLPTGKKYFLQTAVSLSLLSGHFWVYPSTIAQNWDSNLGHLALQWQQQQFERDFQNLAATDSVQAVYPQIIPRQLTHLRNDFHFTNAKNCTDEMRHYFFSPLQSGLSDETILKLLAHPKRKKEYRLGPWQSLWLENIPCSYF